MKLTYLETDLTYQQTIHLFQQTIIFYIKLIHHLLVITILKTNRRSPEDHHPLKNRTIDAL